MQLLSWNGLNIYPLPAQFKAEVTAEDIAQGVKGSCTDCAISLAVCRALGIPVIGMLATSMSEITLHPEAQPSRNYITFSDSVAEWQPCDPDQQERHPCDRDQQEKFIFNFDRGNKVASTTFSYKLSGAINYLEVRG